MAKISVKQAEKQLIAFGLKYPEATLDNPWGHNALKVKGKAFVFLGGEANAPDEFSMTVKLPVSSEMALSLKWVQPAGYGLAKSGWVTARLKTGADFDLGTMKGWIDQSYRAVAPKTLVKALAPYKG